eukprot:3322053-Rhodomonas_salina.1
MAYAISSLLRHVRYHATPFFVLAFFVLAYALWYAMRGTNALYPAARNLFDLAVVIASLFDELYDGGGGGGSGLQSLRVLRVLRVFKTF